MLSKLKAGEMNLYFAISTLHLKFPTGQDMNFFLYFKVNVALFFFLFSFLQTTSLSSLPLPTPTFSLSKGVKGSSSLGRQLINLQYSKTNPENR